jgi:hypothetical protein
VAGEGDPVRFEELGRVRFGSVVGFWHGAIDDL